MGRDETPSAGRRGPRHFNPRAPCGARQPIGVSRIVRRLFQSTRPVWGATNGAAESGRGRTDFNPRAPCGARHNVGSNLSDVEHFNPRAPCGARPAVAAMPSVTALISIHAPRVGRDLSTCPANRCRFISIHAPRVGRDYARYAERYNFNNFNPRAPCGARRDGGKKYSRGGHFNPRAPCGARPALSSTSTNPVQFQSTRPVWGATRI